MNRKPWHLSYREMKVRTLSLNCRKYNYRLLMTSLNQRTLELNQKRKKETKDT
jgi:hypothetical protein